MIPFFEMLVPFFMIFSAQESNQKVLDGSRLQNDEVQMFFLMPIMTFRVSNLESPLSKPTLSPESSLDLTLDRFYVEPIGIF